MHVIARKTIKRFAMEHPDARKPLQGWLACVESAEWDNIDEARKQFPHADAVKVDSGRDVIVFNIKGNTYRLITAIHFNRGKIYTLRFMTHAEYNKDAWKGQL
jgi:mRNA interferase HigB